MNIQFLGAAQTVTGSRYLLTVGKLKVLVDCGLFQGYKNLRLKNWDRFPVPPSEIDAIILTHAHLDHSGYIPLLVKNGFKGKVYCTDATRALSGILLPDSGFIQEEEAKFANKHGFSKHKPAQPLYTKDDAEACLSYFVPVPWKTKFIITNQINQMEFELFPAGHLFGAASVLVYADGKSIAFSGDLGRLSDPITRNPDFHIGADDLVIESTYGNRKHLETDSSEDFRKIILKTFKRKGTLVIPSFAVGRAQLVLHYIKLLKDQKLIPDIKVFLNSPMATKANEVFRNYFSESKMSLSEAKAICDVAETVDTVEESIALNESDTPKIIIAASGMATGGRVLHHLKAFIPDSKNTILFVGYQAGGTRGDLITKGAEEIKIHGEYWPVRAEIAQIDSLSAHADADELIQWISQLKNRPRRIFITHGEMNASDVLRRRIQDELKITAVIPEYQQTFDLDFY